MDMQGIRKYIAVTVELTCIGIVCLLVFGYISNWNRNIFLYDDNYSQWLPVINMTYRGLFEYGKLNIWDMHLMNGINILDTGIYSILNPIMLLSYIVYKVFGVSNTISIYIFMITLLSMLVYNNIMKNQNIKFFHRMAFVLCLLSCSCFYKFGHWYYVFNNLFIGSMMIYYFFKVSHRYIKYVFAGSVLGFSIYMGNVQYTIMWYMFFAIVMIVMAIISDRKYIFYMFSNIMIGIMLNFPQIILNARASAASIAFSDKNSSFFEIPLHLENILVRGFIPECVIQFFMKCPIEEYYFSKDFYFVGILMFAPFISVGLIIRKRGRGNLEKLTMAFIVSIIYFILYSLGRGYLVADILSFFPVINRFRYLHKAYFILPPIMIAVMLYTYRELSSSARSKIIWIGVMLAIVNLVHLDSVGGWADARA